MPSPSFLDTLSSFGHSAAATASKWLAIYWRMGVSKELAATLALAVLAGALARIQSARAMAQEDMTFDERRRSIVSFRNGLALTALCLLALIWAGEIRGILLSVAAIATGLILVSKEIISNFLGGLVFTFTKIAKIGDLIEINGVKGELVDHRWLHLTLMETGESRYYSGNLIRIPNSVLLLGAVRNYSLNAAYRFETLVFHARPEHAAESRKIALAAAAEACAQWQTPASGPSRSQADGHLFQAPEAVPIASLVSVSHDCVEVHTRFPSPRSHRADARQKVSDLYFSRLADYLENHAERHAALAFQGAPAAPRPEPEASPPAAPVL